MLTSTFTNFARTWLLILLFITFVVVISSLLWHLFEWLFVPHSCLLLRLINSWNCILLRWFLLLIFPKLLQKRYIIILFKSAYCSCYLFGIIMLFMMLSFYYSIYEFPAHWLAISSKYLPPFCYFFKRLTSSVPFKDSFF